MSLRRDAAEHRRLILSTAQSLFNQYGVDNVSMHQIAKTVGIGQGTLYRNYSNKADLCLELVRESGRQLDERIRSTLGEPGVKTKVKLENMLRLLLDFLDEKSQWLGAAQAPVCPEGGPAFYRSPVYESLHAHFQGLLEEGIRSGNCPSDLDAVFASDTLLSMLDPGLYLFLTRGRGYSKEAVFRNIQAMWLNALFTEV